MGKSHIVIPLLGAIFIRQNNTRVTWVVTLSFAHSQRHTQNVQSRLYTSINFISEKWPSQHQEWGSHFVHIAKVPWFTFLSRND